MKLGDLKPKGSGKTLREWAEMCKPICCMKCKSYEACRANFPEVNPCDLPVDLEMEA